MRRQGLHRIFAVSPMKISAPLAIRRGAPTWAPATTQGRPYNWPGTPTAIFIRSGEPQDHENSVAKRRHSPQRHRVTEKSRPRISRKRYY